VQAEQFKEAAKLNAQHFLNSDANVAALPKLLNPQNRIALSKIQSIFQA
jgi:hypothetical protein